MTARDLSSDALVAGSTRVDWVACRDGVVYGTAGAAASLGVGALAAGALIEPTPAGEVATAVAAAPIVGWLGGVVALKVSGGLERCVVPLTRVAVAAAAGGAEWAARGITQMIARATSSERTCTDARYRELRAQKSRVCRQAGCTQGRMCRAISCDEKRARHGQGEECLRLRSAISRECFGGLPDPHDHATEETNERNRLAGCQRCFMDDGCPGTL